MKRDISETSLYLEAEGIQSVLRRPGTGLISDLCDLSNNGVCAVFAGAIVDTLIGEPPTRICVTELSTGDTRVLTFGPNTDRLPKFSPDGRHIAFLSDRRELGNFQLYILDPVSGEALATSPVDGWVEYLHWSPDGENILLGVAGHGADTAGAQGAVTHQSLPIGTPSWVPSVDAGEEAHRWRRAWVYELASGKVRKAGTDDLNAWEAVWCGNKAIAAVASPSSVEGTWYGARLRIIDIETGTSREVYNPCDQLGCLSGSPSGRQLAVVEAICSDRWIVAGNLRLLDTTSGRLKTVRTGGVDITYTEWRSERHILLAGHRGFETVVGLYDVDSDVFAETWVSRELSTAGFYATVSGLGQPGDCLVVAESYLRAPELAVVQHGCYRAIKSFDLGYNAQTQDFDPVERVSWRAPDGLEIQGWLLKPKTRQCCPLVMVVHGGPVWHSHPMWLGRRHTSHIMLLNRGYAIFLPNPRGSSGRGQDFVRPVLGDIGGADAYDCLSGLDFLVSRGTADPKRLGITGISYGGFMTAWLTTQDLRFAAAVAVSPHTNQVTEHLLSNIPHLLPLLLADTYNNPGGAYFKRSPVMHSHKAQTPMLLVCGALDRCTPPEEAQQFHNALRENGIESVLVTYPEEGHGVRNWPASIDYAARMVAWFEGHMPPGEPL